MFITITIHTGQSYFTSESATTITLTGGGVGSLRWSLKTAMSSYAGVGFRTTTEFLNITARVRHHRVAGIPSSRVWLLFFLKTFSRTRARAWIRTTTCPHGGRTFTQRRFECKRNGRENDRYAGARVQHHGKASVRRWVARSLAFAPFAARESRGRGKVRGLRWRRHRDRGGVIHRDHLRGEGPGSCTVIARARGILARPSHVRPRSVPGIGAGAAEGRERGGDDDDDDGIVHGRS